VAVSPLLQRHLSQQGVDVDRLFLLDHTGDPDGPGPQLQVLRRPPDILLGAEFVEVGVGVGLGRVGDRAVDRIAWVSLDRIELRGRIVSRHLGLAERRAGQYRTGRRYGRDRQRRLQQRSAVHEDIFRSGRRFRQLPSPSGSDQHGVPPSAILNRDLIPHPDRFEAGAPVRQIKFG
jgi:hypothetical protein